ncbi:MAG: ABC transporter ATP-binding protein [Bacilli bacterium]
MEDYVIEMQHITKEFPGIKANDDITIQIKRGEIHALLGENGAGKSTLMSVLFGLYKPDKGEILKEGKKVEIKNPNDANRLGIGMVHQHFMLVECFTGLENIILGSEPTDKMGFLHAKRVRSEIERLCEKFKFDVDLDIKVSDMTVGMQQKVEILKMLYRKNNILIFDEPTAVLTPQEIDNLMISMKKLIEEGCSIIFISHKLNEIMEVADRCTVLRKGKCVGTVNIKDTNVHALSRLMVGRDVQLVVNKKEAKPGKPVLSIKDLSIYSPVKHKDVVRDVTFNCRAGEITCIAGIEGNGQAELVYGITGLIPSSKGEIILHHVDLSFMSKTRKSLNGDHVYGDVDLTDLSIRKRNLAGISHIPEDRHKYGLILDFDLKTNLVLQRYFEPDFSNHGWIRRDKIRSYADKLIKKYDVRSGKGPDSITRSMSGGNQQKAIVAREIDRDTDLLIAVQPTRGLDVGAIEYIHKQIIAMRDEGKAVLLVSFELDEVMNLSDRILVMYEGEIVADTTPKKTNVQELGLYMSGAKRMKNMKLIHEDPTEKKESESKDIKKDKENVGKKNKSASVPKKRKKNAKPKQEEEEK